jgi:glycerol-3-phosphate acyltransferase PlsX
MIAVDAMGGDFAPHVIVQGALRAAQSGVSVLLFGDQTQIKASLDTLSTQWRTLPIAIEPCTQAIAMHEEATRSVVRKKDASLVRAAHAVREGRASSLVSAGNSGAVLVASTLIIGRVKGVLRPALGKFLPTREGEIFCLDLGANTDCKADFLEQFAYMGSLYVKLFKKSLNPRVGLLSNGHEPYKGSMEVKEAYRRLEKKSDINFIGNVEARDAFSNHADILVADGFVGNVFLKGMQGTIQLLFNWVKTETNRSWFSSLCGFFTWPLFKKIKQVTDYQRVGGALLLGVNKPVVVAHGSAQADAIYHAILFAQETVESKLIEHFNAQLADVLGDRRNSVFNEQKSA